jgi:hypothetical protein
MRWGKWRKGGRRRWVVEGRALFIPNKGMGRGECGEKWKEVACGRKAGQSKGKEVGGEWAVGGGVGKIVVAWESSNNYYQKCLKL